MRFTMLALGPAFTCCVAGALAQPMPPSLTAAPAAPSAPPSTAASSSAASSVTASPEPAALTLAEAWRQAEAVHPLIRSKTAQRAAAEGAQAEARAWLPSNPHLSYDRTQRTVPQPAAETERRQEWSAGLSQDIEIGGQPGHRRDAAAAALAALHAEIDDARRQVRAEVAEQFYRLLASQQRVDLEAQALKLFDDTAQAVRKRKAAGEDTKLDANVALVEAERARNQLALAQEQLLEARGELSSRLQLPPAQMPLAVGELSTGSVNYTRDDLLQAAEMQPQLQALAARETSARARLKLEQASATPDITVGLQIGREGPGDARERLTTWSVSVPLPLFKHNAAGIGQATSDLAQAEIDHQIAQRDTKARVSTLWAKLASLDARVRRLQTVVLPALEDNQQLSVKSQRAGQIGLLELIVVNRQALDARRDLIDALTEYLSTRVALERAAGWPQQGTQP